MHNYSIYIANMKILYGYILREHVGPFFFGLAVITFVLIMDFILEIINLVVAKGLSAWIILQVFALNLAWMLALSVPMAVLVSTLMAFGRLSQDNEITAFKASGVSLYKIVFPPLLVSVLIALGLIWFNNKILPEANHEARLLMSDIHQKRPTLSLREGIFEDQIPGYHILVKKIDQKTSEVEGITIYDQKDRIYPRTIIAEKGNVEFTPDGNTMIFELFNGEIYDLDENDPGYHRRIVFDHQTIYVSDIGTQLTRRTSDFRTDREMNTSRMLEDVKKHEQSISISEQMIDQIAESKTTAVFASKTESEIENKNQLPGDQKVFLRMHRENQNIFSELKNHWANILSQKRQRNSLMVEVHKKYSIPFACLVFILVGAPLGIMSRKGGMAVGLGLSLGFFILYWAFLIGGEELADRGFIPAFWAMWSANILIGIAGVYILIRSAREVTFISWKWIEKFIPKMFRKKQ
ncbi:MAG: LptF/LptG family permease [Candidatus Zixiibacteriota bacterium]